MSDVRQRRRLGGKRFGLALILSLCVHALLVLGIDFDMPEPPAAAASLDVTLAVSPTSPPQQADFQAQASQRGGGQQAVRGSAVMEPAPPADEPVPDDASPGAAAGEHRLAVQASGISSQQRETEEASPPGAGEPDRKGAFVPRVTPQARAEASSPRRRVLAAATLEARDAHYLDGWRKRIEAVGNRHYPEQASRQGVYGSLSLLVALRPDGSVHEVRILRSSGHDLLDRAAQRIVRQAAPFAPFPEEMRRDTDILEIVRTWRFHPGNDLSM